MEEQDSSSNYSTWTTWSSLSSIATDLEHLEMPRRTRQSVSKKFSTINPNTNDNNRKKYHFHGNKMKKNAIKKNYQNKSNINQKVEWYYPPNGGTRIRIHSCGDCEYTTRTRSVLVNHVKRMHPSSTSALPPAPPDRVIATVYQCAECEFQTKEIILFERHRKSHDDKSAFKCPWCSYSVNRSLHLTNHTKQHHTKIDKTKVALSSKNQEPDNSALEKRKELWHYFPSGMRKRYKLCGDCEYKTTTNFNLDQHIKVVHPFSSTALRPPATNMEKDRFRCSHCQFKTSYKSAYEKHDICHRNKAAKHRCHLCSYSVNNHGNMVVHLVLHHRESAEKNNNNDDNKLVTEKSRNNNNSAISSRKIRRYLLSCQDCDSFKTTSRFALKRHVKRAHPHHHHQSVENLVPLEDPERTSREEWFVPSNGKRVRYIYCGDCSYRSITRAYIKQHAEMMHPSSTTAVPAKPSNKRGSSLILRCTLCNYSTDLKQLFLAHDAGHRKKLEYQCTLCSYSCSARTQLGRHLINDHGTKTSTKAFWRCSMCNYQADRAKRLKSHETLHRIKSTFQCHLCSYSIHKHAGLLMHLKSHHSHQDKELIDSEMELEARLRRQFGIKECRVVLHDVYSETILNQENDGRLPSKEVDQVEDVVLEDGKIQVLQSRVKAIKERARFAQEEVKEISLKQMNIQKRIIELVGKKVPTEYDLRSEQCSLLELSLSLIESEDDHSELIKPVEEKIKKLEEEMSTINIHLKTLKDEEKSLAQDLMNAQGSHIGVVQVLKALQSELDELLSLEYSVQKKRN